MKFVLLLFCVGLLSPIFSQTAKTMGDPIPNVDVKLGTKPPGSGKIIATATTDAKGNFEFKNLADGTGYYLEFGIREKGIKSKNRDHTVVIGFACTSGPNKISTGQVKTEKWDDYEVTITVVGNSIKGIVVSRSNIKQK